MKHTYSVVLMFCLYLATGGFAIAEGATVPEPFQEFDPNSKHTIDYADLTAVLKTVVVDVGRSTREKSAPSQAKTGTLMKAKIKRSTANEANRLYYATFKDNEEARRVFKGIQASLEQVPSEVSLKYFSREEQLAYWLNLYNVTLINEIISVYPKRNLKKLLVGKKSILSKKLLTVADIPLSLNDIQYTILKQNYDNDPLIMYGLYQGIIGGPNIRRNAYTGRDVYRNLKNNAMEFTNSNRGTAAKDEKVFRVSSLYGRNRVYFKNFNTDLSTHLLTYLEGYERSDLQAASTIKPDIDDFTVTDLRGNNRDFGGSLANSNAALLDSVKSTASDGTGGVLAASSGYGSATMASKGKTMSRFDQELLTRLHELNLKREATNTANATVTMEELGEVPVEPKPDPEGDSNN
jgi:hypothetical protein